MTNGESFLSPTPPPLSLFCRDLFQRTLNPRVLAISSNCQRNEEEVYLHMESFIAPRDVIDHPRVCHQ